MVLRFVLTENLMLGTSKAEHCRGRISHLSEVPGGSCMHQYTIRLQELLVPSNIIRYTSELPGRGDTGGSSHVWMEAEHSLPDLPGTIST